MLGFDPFRLLFKNDCIGLHGLNMSHMHTR